MFRFKAPDVAEHPQVDPLDHRLVERLVATLQELPALAIQRHALLLLDLPVFEKSLLAGVGDRRIIELLAQIAEGGFQLADPRKALVVVLLDACPLDVDLLLGLVGAVVLPEQLLHVHRGDFGRLGDRRSKRKQGGQEDGDPSHVTPSTRLAAATPRKM